MQLSLPEQTRLVRDRRWRRWVVRGCVSVLFFVPVLFGVAAYLLSSSGITIDEAQSICSQFDEKTTRSEAERLLGKAQLESREGGEVFLYWYFHKHSLNQVDTYVCKMQCEDDGRLGSVVSGTEQTVGWNVWKLRWQLLKVRLGLS